MLFIPPPSQTKFEGPWVYRNHPVCLSVSLSRVNLTLAITFELKETRLSYYLCGFLLTRPYVGTKNFDCVTLTLTFDLLLKKNLVLALTFEPKETTAFISHVCIPCCKTFLYVPETLTLTLNFDLLLKKNLTLAITFEPKEI